MEHRLVQFLQNCKSIRQLKQTHLQIIINGFQGNDFILPKLITLSSDLISLNYAIDIFQFSHSPNFIAYNTMIKCFIGKESFKDPLRFYTRMRRFLVPPNSFTFTFLFRCFESPEAFENGRVIHGHVLKLGFGSSVFVMNTLLDFYAKCCGTLGSACQVFDEMPDRDVVSWNTLIGAYLDVGDVESAIGLFESMPERSIVTWNSIIAGLSKVGRMESARWYFERMPERNEVSWNAIISGYVKAGDVKTAASILDEMPIKPVVSCTAIISGYSMIGDIESARKMFDQMPAKRNVVSWNAMIAGYVQNHMFDQALSVFHHMLIDGKCRPDQTTLVSVSSACAHLGTLEQGKWIDSYIKKNNIVLSLSLGNALIDMFAKCGDLENARGVFLRMTKRCIITWTTMVSALAVNGQCKEAIEMFDWMCLEEIKPDDVIFIAVLTACTHGGLVEEGKRVFKQMIRDFGIKPRMEHYGCMVDLLGRAGKIEAAVRFTESMHLEPSVVIWATLLSACKIHGNGELLESVTKKILDQEPSNPDYLTLITNMSSSVGHWQDALTFRTAMRQQGVEKVPGCSSIQIGDTVHEFFAKDTRHYRRTDIYDALKCLSGQLREELLGCGVKTTNGETKIKKRGGTGLCRGKKSEKPNSINHAATRVQPPGKQKVGLISFVV